MPHAGFFKICLVLIRMGCSLPLQIGAKVSAKDYNTFLDHNESKHCKFRWDNGKVYIVDMPYNVHQEVVGHLFLLFNIPNGGAILNRPISVTGSKSKSIFQSVGSFFRL